ncbi:hypothetical protein Trydic_g12888 [Trypoxylus dichotomus]
MLKPGKDSNATSSFKPIALLVTLRTVFENLIRIRPEGWCEHHMIFPYTMVGFRRGKSEVDNICILATHTGQTFGSNQFMVAGFLDIFGAYDNASIQILANVLRSIKVSTKITRCIFNLFAMKFISLNCEGNSCRIAYTGLPQGSSLSPVLFNIYSHKLAMLTTVP